MQPVPRRLTMAFAAALLILLAAAGSAAAFSVTSVTATPRAPVLGEPGFGVPGILPADPAASGAHPVMDITTTFDVSDGRGGATTARDIVQHLGAGIVANPHATAQCSQASFNAASPAPVGCAANTQVGTATATVLVAPLVTRTLSGAIYNLEPNAGQPAALGIAFDLTPLGRAGLFLKDFAAVTVDPTDLGLLTTLSGLNPTLPIVATRLTLWGYAATGGTPPLVPYFTNPAACSPAAVSVSATAYDGETGTNSGSYTPTACDTAPFDTSLTVSANPSSTDSLSAISVDVKPALIFVPRVNSYIRQNTVTLPPGTLLNPALAASLDACTDAQFARSNPGVAPACPASSEIGRVTFVSPILGPFVGKAYFGTGNATDTLRLFLDVPLFGAHIKVIGGVRPDALTGQVTTVFDDLPQVAFTDFQVDFNGAPLSVFTTPTTCGTNTATAVNHPYSGGPASTPSGSFTTSYDGHGAPCVTKFQPYFTGAPSSGKSGATTPYTLKFARPDRNQSIGSVTFRLPRGLTGNLALRGLTQCSLADAAKAACADASKVGTAQVQVGSGPAPASLPGTVFLTAPKVGGDPAALSVLVPAKLGPVDLGNVIVGVRLQLRSDGGLNAISDPLPQLQKGITTSVRVATIALTRPGFMRNPTSCGKRRYSGVFDAVGGGSATTFAAFTLADCGKLAFTPKFSVTVGARGKTGAGSHPPLTTTITQSNGQSAISRAHVVLPTALPANSIGLAQACSQAAFDAKRCSKRAQIATARAVSPFVTRSLSGPVWLVKQVRKLPKLVVQLRGPLSIDLTGQITIGKDNKIATTFGTVPDLPVTKFTLSFHSGTYGIIAANTDLCAQRLFAPTQFNGQNGKTQKLRPRITVNGCTKKHKR
ncbi:MAG TPA: hypothetical protein VFF79_00675 [Conexibacter sp.]|jgi:hypothetical protein|nr:hypothetical protein [Conexibacter sp.]